MNGMHDPAHPGKIIREALEAEQWTVTEAALKGRLKSAFCFI